MAARVGLVLRLGRDSLPHTSQRRWGGDADSPGLRGPSPCPHPQLFAVGGFDGLRRLRSVERYDPFSNTWAAAAPLPEAVSSAAVAPCAGQLYVIGGAGQDGVSTDKVGAERASEACCVPGAELAPSCPPPFSHLIPSTALKSHLVFQARQ